MKTFPTLYQRTQTGAIQQWTIEVASEYNYSSAELGEIVTRWGQVDGAMQVTRDIIKTGKNTGKANATTAVQQAEKEAEAKWVKQKKKGYVESIEQAQAGEVDAAVILGGVEPMLAPNKSYPSDAKLAAKIVFPAYVQPKFDGMRCIAVIKDSKATLWSRTRKPIRSVPHIVEELERCFSNQDVILDGELYAHDLKDEFEELISIVRKDAPDAEGRYRTMQYHVYDVVIPSRPFKERLAVLEGWVSTDILRFVHTTKVLTQENALVKQAEFEEQGYEGAMIRNAHGPYEQDKRSFHLQKMKSWLDGEFQIVGVEEGRGKDAGTVGAFVCVIDSKGAWVDPSPPLSSARFGAEFRCRLKTPYARRRELFEHPEQWRDRLLTVRYKRFTSDGMPYLPIGMSIRDYE